MDLETLVSQIANSSSDGIFIAEVSQKTGRSPRLVWCNAAATEQTGYLKDELLSKRIDLVLGAPPNGKTTDEILEKLAEAKPIRKTFRNYRRSGSSYWASVHLTPIQLKSSEVRYWICFQHDVSEYEQMRKKLAAEHARAEQMQKRLWNAIEALPDAFVMFDKDDRLIVCNEKFKQFYEISAPAIKPGATFEEIMRYGLENGQYPEAAGNEEAWLLDRLDRAARLTKPRDRELPGNRFIVIHDMETENGDMVGLRTDVTQLRMQQRTLEFQASALAKAQKHAEEASRTDPLTGVGNRRGLDLFLKNLKETGKSSKKVGLVHVDLDRFKAVNDQFGHDAGDHLLCVVAKKLRAHARAQDFVARVGGDEFAVVVISDRAITATENVAERIVTACKDPVVFNGDMLHFGASVGTAVASIDRADELMKKADLALYEAKARGRGRFVTFAPELLTAAKEQRILGDELEKGLAEDQIFPHFQPQVSSDDHSMVGVEALARWHHPTRGYIAPGVFLPVADEIGLLTEIDEQILKKAMQILWRLRDKNILIPKLSINIGTHRLQSQTLVKRLAALKPWPSRLALELLETIDFDDEANDHRTLMDECRAQGAEIELDDFGSGNASLTTITGLKPDRIKLDKRITATIDSEVPGAGPIVKAICDMSKALDIKVTAEGVETLSQAKVLKRYGCDVLQGYLFSPALSEADLISWVLGQDESNEVMLGRA